MSAADLARRLNKLATVPDTATREAGKQAEMIARRVGAQFGPMRLGRRNRITPLKGRAVYRGRGRLVEATLWGTPTGPWVWATTGTAAHQIPKARNRRGKPRYLRGAGYAHPYRGVVTHPGTGGRGAWNQVQAQCRTKLPKVYVDAVHAAVGRL